MTMTETRKKAMVNLDCSYKPAAPKKQPVSIMGITSKMKMMALVTIVIVVIGLSNNNDAVFVSAFSSSASTITRPLSQLPGSSGGMISSIVILTDTTTTRSSSSSRLIHNNKISSSTPTILFSSINDNNDESTSSNDEPPKEEQQSTKPAVEIDSTTSLTTSQIESLADNKSFLSNIRSMFKGDKNTFNMESLRKLGVSALLAYGFVSNLSGVIAVSSAWFIFSKKTGISPLANKPAFLTIYAGFTVMLNVIRPARFALSISISPYFERIRKYFQRKFSVSPKGAAVLMIVFINLLGTTSLMCAGVGLASLLSGVPVWSK